MTSKQLALDVSLHEVCNFANFIAGENQLVIEVLQRLARTKGGEFCYCLHGAHGSGKTHLIGALLNECENNGKRCAYYPLDDWQHLDPHMLLDDWQPEVLCLDNLHKVLGQADWECALFECYNLRQIKNLPILVTMLYSPKDSMFLLSDLKSRLMAGLLFKLKSMTDDERLQCLQLRAKQRGLSLPNAVTRFLLEHYTRDNHSLLNALDKLDVASIEEQRALTIPFVKRVLGL